MRSNIGTIACCFHSYKLRTRGRLTVLLVIWPLVSKSTGQIVSLNLYQLASKNIYRMFEMVFVPRLSISVVVRYLTYLPISVNLSATICSDYYVPP